MMEKKLSASGDFVGAILVPEATSDFLAPSVPLSFKLKSCIGLQILL